jgi:recombinational DNA repair ATPase RecF
MYLKLRNWRKFEYSEFELPESSFAICDSNGSGKTSILSAIYGLYTLQPWPDQVFRSGLKHSSKFFGIENQELFLGGQIEPSGRLKIKHEFLTENHTPPLIQLYTPVDNQLFQLSRSKKLDFIDRILCQIVPEYSQNLRKLNKVLASKQSMIKAISEDRQTVDHILLKNLHQLLWEFSHYFWWQRRRLFSFWQSQIQQVESWLDLSLSGFELVYETTTASTLKQKIALDTVNFENTKMSFESYEHENLVEFFEPIWTRELASGRILWGAQRDDFEIQIAGENINGILSRGETRLLILWLKYLSIDYARKVFQLKSKIWWLLDDAFNELDTDREKVLIHEILKNADWYVITTTKKQNICTNFSLKDLKSKK